MGKTVFVGDRCVVCGGHLAVYTGGLPGGYKGKEVYCTRCGLVYKKIPPKELQKRDDNDEV